MTSDTKLSKKQREECKRLALQALKNQIYENVGMPVEPGTENQYRYYAGHIDGFTAGVELERKRSDSIERLHATVIEQLQRAQGAAIKAEKQRAHFLFQALEAIMFEAREYDVFPYRETAREALAQYQKGTSDE